MRWLPIAFVLVALAFTTGGVRADSKSEAAAPTAQPGAAAPVADQCPVPATPQKIVLRRDPKKVVPSVTLNTRGYNYTDPGEWRPSPTAKPTGAPEGVLPEATTEARESDPPNAPPAAPAKN